MWPWSCCRPCSTHRQFTAQPREAPCFIRASTANRSGAIGEAPESNGSIVSRNFPTGFSRSRFRSQLWRGSAPDLAGLFDKRADVAKEHRSIGARDVPQESTGVCENRPKWTHTICYCLPEGNAWNVATSFKSRNSEDEHPEYHTMHLATRLIVESRHRSYTVVLRRPLTLTDIYFHFVRRCRRPQIAALSGHVARVTLR